jgi:glutaminyl-peptide cyclotransferase
VAPPWRKHIGTAALTTAILFLLGACGRFGDSHAAPTPPPPLVVAPSGAQNATTETAGDTAPAEDATTTVTEPGGTASTATATATAEAVPAFKGHHVVKVLGQYPHDSTMWTEGLEFFQGRLLESSGIMGRSTLRLVDPHSGAAEELLAVADDLYAEGVTAIGDQAFQLTYQEQTLLVTSLSDLTPASVARQANAYDGEGWGLCYDGTHLVMSNGSSELQFRDPTTFELTGTVAVTLNGAPIDQLNELECLGQQILANIWLTSSIVAINPTTGVVEATVDASSLVPRPFVGSDDEVLNGIAYNRETGTFWLTGKLWPTMYEVTFVAV